MLRRGLKGLGGVFVLGVGAWLLDAAFPFRFRVPYATEVLAADSTVLHTFLSEDDKWRLHADLNEVSPTLRAAILWKEDRYFYYHPGINPVAVGRALWRNARAGRVVSGASTITMQTVRLLRQRAYGPPPRTWAEKGAEALRALQLEWYYTKDEILALYLNLIPYGGNVEGVKAAALLYLGQRPDRLSPAQVATLTVVPNRPQAWGLSGGSDALRRARNRWLDRLAAAGLWSAAVAEAARAEPLDCYRRPVPRVAPHLARRLRRAAPTARTLRTTLRPALQDRVARLVRNYSRRARAQGVHNAAALVVDHQTDAVVAYVGSPNFADERHAGQVDGVMALRAPGSTLKPFVYALAFDRGLVTPRRKLADVPTEYAGYAPENYDARYRGRVSAERALSLSLNVPAVALLAEVGLEPLLRTLAAAGTRSLDAQRDRLGLSVALGGCGLTLEELVGMYAALARGGRYRPLRYAPGLAPGPDSGRAVVSAAAAFVVGDMLRTLQRPDLPHHDQRHADRPAVAWKTGTSYGHRDAWCLGFDGRYTVGVWVGNFSGEGVPALSGARLATPLLFEVFGALGRAGTTVPRPPAALRFRMVCAETGRPPGPHCDHQVTDYFLPLVSDVTPCDHRTEVSVSPDGRYRYCAACRPPTGYRQALYENPPPALLAYARAQGTAPPAPPPHYPRCQRLARGTAPRIVSPADGSEYFVGGKEDAALLLRSEPASGVRRVYWYLNDQFYAAAAPHEPVFFTPAAGALKVTCTDDQGRRSTAAVRVLPLAAW